MERVKFDSKEFEIINMGVITGENSITLKMLPSDSTLDEINTLLLSKAEVTKITILSESGEEVAIHNGYTKLSSITQEFDVEISDGETGRLVTVVLAKPNDTEARIDTLEQQTTDLQMALCDIYEGVV